MAANIYQAVKQAMQDLIAPQLESVKGEISAVRSEVKGEISALRSYDTSQVSPRLRSSSRSPCPAVARAWLNWWAIASS